MQRARPGDGLATQPARWASLFLACFVVVLLAWHGPALAGKRLALVLGNSLYQTVPRLDNPANDAADVAQALRGMGFEVIELRDGTRDSMAKAVRDFSGQMAGAE